jgi:hypothetical protein
MWGAASTGSVQMPQCPICKSEAEEIDLGLFDDAAFDCKTDGRFRVAGTVFALPQGWARWQWETALTIAKRVAAPGALPLIKSDYL